MPSILQALRNNKPIILGLIVAPLGLYSGMKIKEYREQSKAQVLKKETSAPLPTEDLDTDTQIRLELQDLRNVRASLRKRESLLVNETESIDLKMKRLQEREELMKSRRSGN